MKELDIFVMSDAALREVIDNLEPEQLETPVPAEWSRVPVKTLRDILALHAYDEAWIPDLLGGKTPDEVGDRWKGDLLGDDPIASYDDLNDIANEFIATGDLSDPVHMSYGEYPLPEGLLHMSVYRAFQAWSIAHLVGMDFTLPDALVDLLDEALSPHIDEWRGWGIFPPAVDVPADADAQTRLLGKTGYLVP